MELLTDEHRMLQNSLDGLLAAASGPEDIWPQLAELGMLGLTLPEAAGGAGLGLPELLLFARRMGRAGLSGAYAGAEILAMPLLADCAARPGVAPLLPALIGGSRIATLALPGPVPPRAEAVPGGGFRLEGEVSLVPSGSVADLVLLTATLRGAPALFLVATAASGVSLRPYLPAGPEAGADIGLDGVALDPDALLATGEEALRLVAEAAARGQLAACAEMLGAMEMLLDLTADYLRTRQQFGQPLAAFQVLQHAAVDMYVEIETARAMLDYGSRMFAVPEAERALALAAVKLKLNGAAKVVGETAVQLHGGIGMTAESLTGRLFARLTRLRLAFGDSRSCLRRLVASETSIALG